MFGEILRNFSKSESENCDFPKILSWGSILGNFSRISEESVTGNDCREIPRKFVKKSHHIWRIWGNFSLLLPQEHLSVENNFLKNYLIFSGSILWQPVMHSQVHFSESFTLHSGVHFSGNFIKNKKL